MTTELVKTGTPVNFSPERVQQFGHLLARSGYFADARDAAQASVKVLAGEELGLGPVASMMGINIIKGKVGLSANLMAAQVRRHGYNYRVKSMVATGCVLEFIGKDGKTVLGESSFTEKDAKDAGVYSEMYRKFPRNMYFSRAMSNGVKWFCPEVTSGLPIYTPEELGAPVTGDGEMVEPEAPAPPQTLTPRPEPVIEQQRPPAARTWPGVPEDVQELWRGMHSIPTIVKTMQEAKQCLAEYVGGESADRKYREILGKYKQKDGKPVEHSNQFAKFRDAWDAARELFEINKEFKATGHSLYVSEADIVEDEPEVQP